LEFGPEASGRTGEAIKNRYSLIVNPFFFRDEKETKNQDLGFSAIKIGSPPKAQKTPSL
jgi:hypothetical protein